MKVSRNFEQSELSCKCCGFYNFKQDTLEKLQNARDFAGIGFVINSGCRCKKHNAEVGGKSNSAHLSGRAVDIATPNSNARFIIIKALIDAGFVRIGYNSKKKFLHVDNDPSKPQNVLFDY